MSEHHHHHGHCAHSEIQMEKFFLFIIAGGLLVLASALNGWFNIVGPEVAKLPAAVGAIMLGIPMILAAFKELKRGRPSSSSLAALAIVAAIANLEFVAAGLLAFILLVVEQFLDRTAFGAQRAIEELVELTPDKARVVVDGQEVDRGLEHVSVGDTVRVRPGENLPVDGRVIRGKSSMNMASLTGESAPVEVQEGAEVYAGTTNLTGAIDIEVTRLGGETAIGKVSHLIGQAESARTQRQLLIEQVASFFVPVALAVAGTTWFIMSVNEETRPHAALTAVSVLVVTCPAALVISSPTAMVAAFAAAARLGVMIKDSRHLETMANLDAVVMDKTGTITTGEFKVSRLAPAPGVEGAALLAAAANGEQHSNHPLAQSILKTAREARIDVDGSQDYEEIHGRGVRATTSLGAICVGRASWVREEFPELAAQMAEVETKIEGMSGVHVVQDGRYLGAVGLADTIRPSTKAVITRLRELGVRSVAIFTGDRFSVAKRVGVEVGADRIEAECLPEEKHEQIQQLVDDGYRTLMIGDGINDGPSLAAADVGIAMGLSGTDIAANSAGIALMNDDLSRVPFTMELARRTRVIISQNIAASIVIVIIGLILASLGMLDIWAAAFYHFAGEVFVIGNSFRLFRFGEEFATAEATAQQAQQRARRAASVRGLATS